jgi:hypothetical protein
LSAPEAVGEYACEHCRGVREALEGAELNGPWLAAGPIRTGIRLRMAPGVFPVGNLAGEVHPVAAEGISMAMQSSWLLTRLLTAWRLAGAAREDLPTVGERFAHAWRRSFAPRVRAGAVIAHWSMRPRAVTAILPLLRCFPQLLTLGARCTGKATSVVKR